MRLVGRDGVKYTAGLTDTTTLVLDASRRAVTYARSLACRAYAIATFRDIPPYRQNGLALFYFPVPL
jgi:hypothetical protein